MSRSEGTHSHHTIDPKKDLAIKEWMRTEGWSSAASAEWRQDPDAGFWAWRHVKRDEPLYILAIHEPLVRQLAADELVATLRVLQVADELRVKQKVRVWEGGRVSHY
jgi:hypothetical protein